MRKNIILGLMIVVTLPLFSLNELSLKTGVLLVADRDLTNSPVLNSSLLPIGDLSYSWGEIEGFHHVNAFFSMGEISSSISDIEVYRTTDVKRLRGDTNITSDMDYTYWFRASEISDFNFYFGVGIEVDFQMVLVDYPVFTTSTSLNIGAGVTKKINEHNLSASIQIPVVTYLNRAPFTGTNDVIMDQAGNDMLGLLTSGYITSVNDYLNIDFNFAYQYGITKNLKLDSSLSFGYTYIDTPREKWMIESALLLGVCYNFEGEK